MGWQWRRLGEFLLCRTSAGALGGSPEGHICRVMGLSSRVPHWPDQGAMLMGHKLKCPWGQANMVRE